MESNGNFYYAIGTHQLYKTGTLPLLNPKHLMNSTLLHMIWRKSVSKFFDNYQAFKVYFCSKFYYTQFLIRDKIFKYQDITIFYAVLLRP